MASYEGKTSMNMTLIDSSIFSLDSNVTLLSVENGFINEAGEAYDRNGTFIDFPRELGSKTRKNLDMTSVIKKMRNTTIACLVHERKNYSYFHWIFETLPKFIYLKNNKSDIDFDKIYYHCGLLGTPYERQALNILGFRRWHLLDARRLKSLNASRIIVIKLEEQRRNPSLFLCKSLKKAFIKESMVKPVRRIYLTRKNVKSGRKIVNEIELIRILNSLDFQIVDPAKLSFAKQVELFNESEYIVSPHGAALANIVFCNSGAKVIELFNHPDICQGSQSYLNIARTCNLQLIRLPAKDNAKIATTYSNRSDFSVDIDAVRSALKQFNL